MVRLLGEGGYIANSAAEESTHILPGAPKLISGTPPDMVFTTTPASPSALRSTSSNLPS